jgi:RNA polymerase sigma-70 factor (ECF subfamily)
LPDSSDRSSVVSRAQEGDEEAFAALFEMHKKRVYSLCLFMTGDVATAEDLTQEVFIQVFRKIRTFRGDAAFSTWLHRIALNTVLMSRRKRIPPQVSLDEPVYIGSSSLQRELAWNDPELSGTPERMALIQGINRLPEGCRAIFILHEVEGYGHDEIARLLGCSAGNSKSQLHKARMKLREFLFPEGGKRFAEMTG